MKAKERCLAVLNCLAALVLASPEMTTAAEPEIRKVGSRRELFVDRYLVDRLDSVRFQLHHPHPAETAVTLDQPWEKRFHNGVSVIKDGRRFLLYYSAFNRLAVAVSDDGVRWSKPKLGLVEVEGSRENNLVGTTDGKLMIEETKPLPEVFLDTRPGMKPEERFKAFTLIERPGVTKVVGWVSSDGFSFRKLRDEPIIETSLYGAFDGFESLFWSNVVQGLSVLLPQLVRPESWKSPAQPEAPGELTLVASAPELSNVKVLIETKESTRTLAIARAVLIIRQTRTTHDEIKEVIRRVQAGDPLGGGGRRGGGGGGGFGGGLFSVPRGNASEQSD